VDSVKARCTPEQAAAAEKKLEELMVTLGLAGGEESAQNETTYDDIHVISAQDEGCCAEVYRHEKTINQTVTWVTTLGSSAVMLVVVVLFSHFMFWNWNSPHKGEWSRTACTVTVVPGQVGCAGVKTVVNFMNGESPSTVDCCQLTVQYMIRIAYQEGEISHLWNVTEPASLFKDREIQDPCVPAADTKYCWYGTPSAFTRVETAMYFDAVDAALEYPGGERVLGLVFPVIHCRSPACYTATVASAISLLLMAAGCIWAMANPGGLVVTRTTHDMPWDDSESESEHG
jgi:hypothetical protein